MFHSSVLHRGDEDVPFSDELLSADVVVKIGAVVFEKDAGMEVVVAAELAVGSVLFTGAPASVFVMGVILVPCAVEVVVLVEDANVVPFANVSSLSWTVVLPSLRD